MTKHSGTLTPKIGNAPEPAGEFIRRKDYDALVAALREIASTPSTSNPKTLAGVMATARAALAKAQL